MKPPPEPKLPFSLACGVLAASVVAAALTAHTANWHPLGLLGLLTVLSLVGDHIEVRLRHQRLSAGVVGLVLATTLLGPAPGAVIAFISTLVTEVRTQYSTVKFIKNLYAQIPYIVVGGLIARGMSRWLGGHGTVGAISYGLIVFGVFLVSITINFFVIALYRKIADGDDLRKQARYLFVPILPGQAATAAMTGILASAYKNLGYPALLGLVFLLLIFQHLIAALLKSEERADQLEARSIRLASLQLGVLVTLVETLALRDRTAARHAAAVARYARSLAEELECSEADQEIVHAAGLLHDIGKFALPDRILQAAHPSPEDRVVIRRHPQEGATLVGRLDGYGPVADLILYHHEHVDGTGYPAGLIGAEIPYLSRILAVANAFDSLTASDATNPGLIPRDAFVELRKMAGRSLDADIVERFIHALERAGPVLQADGDHADFAEELAFERRARTLAQPAYT